MMKYCWVSAGKLQLFMQLQAREQAVRGPAEILTPAQVNKPRLLTV